MLLVKLHKPLSMKWPLPVFLILLLSQLPALAQDVYIDSTLVGSEEQQVLHTKRGDIFFGSTLSIATDSIQFQIRDLSAVTFPRSEVRWLGLVENAGWLRDEVTFPNGIYDYEVLHWSENLSYSMTAFCLSRGTEEYRNISILYNVFDAGLTDHFSIGGGMIVPFLFVIRSKLAFSVGEKFHLGAGMSHLIGTGAEAEGFVSHLFGIGTFGTPKQYLNITAGVAHEWEFPDDSPFIITIGGGVSFAPNWKIYADAGLSPGNEGIIPTIMLSWFKKRNRLEFGVLGVADGFISAIPMIGYAHRF